MDDDGLQTQDQLEEVPLLVEVHDTVEFDVVPAAGEDPVLVDELFTGDCVVHATQVYELVVDLEDQCQRDAEEDRMVGDSVQPADDKKGDCCHDGHQFVNQQLPPVGADLHLFVWIVTSHRLSVVFVLLLVGFLRFDGTVSVQVAPDGFLLGSFATE